MAQGFYDESAEQKPLTGALVRLTLGGFIASWEQVRELNRKWQAALELESWASFHMRKSFSDEDAYEAWPLARQESLDRFVGILCEHASRFCGYCYSPTNERREFKDPYETALARVTMDAAKIARDSGEKVSLVFAKTGEISGELIGRYFDNANWHEDYISSYSVALAAAYPPLQAAEIVARAVKRKAQDGFVTHSLQCLLATGKPFDVRGINL